MQNPCGHCGNLVDYFFDGEFYMKMIPISKYWKTIDDHRFHEITEPYCSALCGLRRYESINKANMEKKK